MKVSEDVCLTGCRDSCSVSEDGGWEEMPGGILELSEKRRGGKSGHEGYEENHG